MPWQGFGSRQTAIQHFVGIKSMMEEMEEFAYLMEDEVGISSKCILNYAQAKVNIIKFFSQNTAGMYSTCL